MELQLRDVISIIGLLVVVFVQTWAVVKFLIGRDTELHKRMEEHAREVHERINDVRNEYVRRDDHGRDLTRIDGELRQLRDDIRELSKTIDVHFKQLFSEILRIKSDE